MEHIFKLAEQNTRTAESIVRDLDMEGVWGSIGATVNLVGSLKTGLLVKHRDIDFHVYTPELRLADSFSAMARLMANPRVTRIECVNLINTEEHCIEWHAWYRDRDGQIWQIDIIHILRGSTYDGFAERLAERITATLTPETREAVFRLKHATPEDEKVMGIEYYLAVFRDGVRDYPAFMEWRKQNPMDEIALWTP